MRKKLELAGGLSEQILHLMRETRTLKVGLLAQGEKFNQETLDRKAEVDRLKIKIEALKRLLDEIQPGFAAAFDRVYAEECLRFDPELDREAS